MKVKPWSWLTHNCQSLSPFLWHEAARIISTCTSPGWDASLSQVTPLPLLFLHYTPVFQNILMPVYHLLLLAHHLDCKSKIKPLLVKQCYYNNKDKMKFWQTKLGVLSIEPKIPVCILLRKFPLVNGTAFSDISQFFENFPRNFFTIWLRFKFQNFCWITSGHGITG